MIPKLFSAEVQYRLCLDFNILVNLCVYGCRADVSRSTMAQYYRYAVLLYYFILLLLDSGSVYHHGTYSTFAVDLNLSNKNRIMIKLLR